SPFYCRPLVKALREAGADAELASPQLYLEPGLEPDYSPSPWVVDLTVRVSRPRAVRLAARAVDLSWNFPRLLRAIRHNRYDVVHVQWIPLQEKQSIFMSRLRAACGRASIPLVFTAHNVMPHDSPGANRGMVRKNIDLAHLVIAHTENVADGLRCELGVRTKITVIPHAPLFIDLHLPSREDARARLSLGNDPVLLFQGRIEPYKGIDVLVETWPLVREVFPTAVLAVVGRSGTEEVRSQLARLAQEPGVRIVDAFVPTALMLDYYAASDVVVFPYKAISQSGALMTAVGLGRPAVVTSIPGFLEQARDLGSVLVAAGSDGTAVARAVCRALADRDHLADEAARDRLRIRESSRGWPAVARSTLDAYARARAGLVAAG
ncbi:MAG: hypothetical protein A2W26_08670, partial [Acidobacteria bacterium RBG_16_64_8]